MSGSLPDPLSDSLSGFLSCRAAVSIWLSIWLATLLLSGATQALAGDPAVPMDQKAEYKVKAAYIYNFIKFIDWPAGRLESGTKPIQVCVLGDDPFGKALEPLSRRRVKERDLAVRSLTSVAQAGTCHVVFISDSQVRDLSGILEELGRVGALTVGESEGFARFGGIIGFVIRGGKVRLEINRAAAREANLTISAKLLELATIVK